MDNVSSARLERSSIAAGWTLVAAIVVAVALVAVSTTLGTTIYQIPVGLAFGLAVVLSAAVPLALAYPLFAGILGAVAVTGLAFAQVTVVGAPWPWAVTTIVTQAILIALIGLQARSRVGLVMWLLAVAGTIVAAAMHPRGTDAAAINIIIASSVTALALAGGIVAREWRSIRAQLLRERAVSAEEHQRRMLAEEKARIARELHDVVAHSMSIINVQASSAVYRHSKVSDPVAREFEEIAEAARTAIKELRGVLKVLREEDAAPELAPQPGLRDIPLLVDATARSGVDVTLTFDPALIETTVADAAGLAAYRIVQEGLSNAMRHAPRAPITVTCTKDRDLIVLTITNPRGVTVASTPSEPGHGLIGMRERVLAVSGSLQAQPAPDGGFTVVAQIPAKAAR